MKSKRRFEATGKYVFRDNMNRIYYVMLNDNRLISVEGTPEEMAILAWSQSSIKHKKEFILKFFNGKYQETANNDWIDIPNDMKYRIIAYQTEKLK